MWWKVLVIFNHFVHKFSQNDIKVDFRFQQKHSIHRHSINWNRVIRGNWIYLSQEKTMLFTLRYLKLKIEPYLYGMVWLWVCITFLTPSRLLWSILRIFIIQIVNGFCPIDRQKWDYTVACNILFLLLDYFIYNFYLHKIIKLLNFTFSMLSILFDLFLSSLSTAFIFH